VYRVTQDGLRLCSATTNAEPRIKAAMIRQPFLVNAGPIPLLPLVQPASHGAPPNNNSAATAAAVTTIMTLCAVFMHQLAAVKSIRQVQLGSVNKLTRLLCTRSNLPASHERQSDPFAGKSHTALP
jgi:hypothetical protein